MPIRFQVLLPDRPLDGSFAERHAGLLISLSLHLALVALMAVYAQQIMLPQVVPARDIMHLRLTDPAPRSTPVPVTTAAALDVAAAPTPPTPTAATTTAPGDAPPDTLPPPAVNAPPSMEGDAAGQSIDQAVAQFLEAPATGEAPEPAATTVAKGEPRPALGEPSGSKMMPTGPPVDPEAPQVRREDVEAFLGTPASEVGGTELTPRDPLTPETLTVDGARAADGPSSGSLEGDPEWTPERAALLAELKERRVAMEQENALRGQMGSTELSSRLTAARVDVKAQQSLFSSRGAETGAIRELDIHNIPNDQAWEVLGRYGIRMLSGAADSGRDSGASFLNSARTEDGRFVNTQGGSMKVFRYGERAVARMMQLESDALVREGYDPMQTRVVRVVFGVVPSGTGYDLGVTKLEVAPIPPTPQ